MKIHSTLMAGAAAMTMIATGAQAAVGSQPQKNNLPPAPMMLAQNYATSQSSTAELEARLSALEEELQRTQMQQSEMANKAPAVAPGWWNNTTISGRMYYDVTNVENKSNGVRKAGNGNGFNFDIKRFYVGIDHTFDKMFSANVTTDTTYDGGSSTGQIYLKKAYLQAKIDPALTLRVGATDLPWVPYVEGIYGYRYLENTLIDRTKFGTSADWGVHASGALLDGVVNYGFAVVNGAGYKKIPVGGGANRGESFDFEGRISAAYEGFNVAVGGYTGKLGTPYGTATNKTAERLDLLAAYVGNGMRLGVEWFTATNYSAAQLSTASVGDSAHGVSGFASYTFVPQWSVFGRFDSVDTNARTAPARNNQYYNVGISWQPTKIVEFALAYKHDAIYRGTFSDSNATLGAAGALNGTYNEIGLFGTLQW